MIKDIINQYEGLDENDILNLLAQRNDISRFEKNLIYSYLCPKPIGNYELPGIILKERGNHPEGFLKPNEREIPILLRAFRTRMYRNYMLHLLHSFIEHPDDIFVVNETENKVCECCVCKKPLLTYSPWMTSCSEHPNFKESERKETLAYGSDQTDLSICLNCLIQLKSLDGIIKDIEGENYLTKWM